MTYLGLTWDHPRGYDALAEAARRVNAGRSAPMIHWDKQSLEGFESAPITELTAEYDLVVLDHPHIGEAVTEGSLRPLEDHYSASQIATWAGQSVGPSFTSYRWEDQHWALPLDVATQVVARRPDLLPAAPGSWVEIEEIAKRLPVALSLGGPHAFLTLISLCGAEGHVMSGSDMLPEEPALMALSRIRRLAERAPAGTEVLNPINLLEAMARNDAIALVPLIFGYVTYARAGHAAHVIAFSDTPRAPNGHGGVLGGTGIAISTRSDPSPDLLDHVASLLSDPTQCDLFPAFGGQPSSKRAWESAAVDADWGGFYRSTIATAGHALVRHRFDGFPAFTNAAAARIRDGLKARDTEIKMLTDLRHLWQDARGAARGPLDERREMT